MASLPPAGTLPSASGDTLRHVLDTLFEPSPQLHQLALPLIRQNDYNTYDDLVDDLRARLKNWSSSHASSADLHGILGSHPRLGEKNVKSAQSAAEQAQLQGADSDAAKEEAQRLKELNAEYEKRFPGLRYVVFVNGRSRNVIMEDMRRRIDRGDMAAEEVEAIDVSSPILLFPSPFESRAMHRFRVVVC
jgi:2-oxo-4-hydroxy-4-carboxy--5-ureidoimidazoline (OHCU) decarboxylase